MTKQSAPGRAPAMPVRILSAVGVALAVVLGVTATALPAAAQDILRIGHFPNITHVQALVARQMERQGKNWFTERLGNDVKIEWYAYNAGPSAMEAIFANSVDLTFVGPSPAINAYARSRGDEVRVVAGAANGASALVVQGDSGLQQPSDFRGKRIGTPQLGNTQDVSARAWLIDGGLRITQTGGDAHVVPVARSKYLADHRDRVRRFVAAHRELTEWIQRYPEQAQNLAREEMRTTFRANLPADLVARAWSRTIITADVSVDGFQSYVTKARKVGFLRDVPDLSRLFETP
jgi:NitT/TauT family transport system substrate-binding protein